MQKSNLRVFEINGRSMTFCTDTFNMVFRNKAKSRKETFEDFTEEMAEVIHVSASTIKSWRYHQSGPGSVELVEAAADFLDLELDDLLVEKREGQDMRQQYTDRQLEAARRVYAAIVEFLDEFEISSGFNNYWHELVDSGVESQFVQEKLYELVMEKHRRVRLVAKEEAFDLHGTPLHEAFLDYIDGILMDIWDYPKLAYAYRFEEPVSWDGLTSGEIDEIQDLNLANRALQGILDDCL